MSIWKPSRAVFADFWIFDNQEFQIQDGKLLLRGDNGAGKSVTMQSLLPVMLDGNTSSRRLDPFGSKERKMEYYVLMDEKMTDRTERTSYMLLEFEKKDEKRYITLGMGLRGRKGKADLDIWHFIVTDNRRIGMDFDVCRERTSSSGETELVTLSKAELQKVLDNALFFEHRDRVHYALAVNKTLFGFSSLEVFESWIHLLIQLRMPKLANAKDMNFNTLYEILKEAQSPLTDEELRVLIDSITHIDSIHEDLALKQAERQSLKRVSSAYDRLNKIILLEKAEQYQQAEKSFCSSDNEIKEARELLAITQAEKETLYTNIQLLEDEQRALNTEKNIFSDHEAIGLLDKKADLVNEIKVKQSLLVEKNQSLKSAEDRYRQTLSNRNAICESCNALEAKQRLHLEELDEYADRSYYFEHDIYRKSSNPVFPSWRKSAYEYRYDLNRAYEKLMAYEALEIKQRSLSEERGSEQRKLDKAKETIQGLHGDLLTERELYMSAVASWIRSLEVLSFHDHERERLFAIANEIGGKEDFQELYGVVSLATRRVEQKKTGRIASLHAEEKMNREQLERIKAEVNIWKTIKDPEPIRPKSRNDFRRGLTERGIHYAPLYALIEFKENVSEEIRKNMEGALEAAGILDAIISPSLSLGDLHDDSMIPSVGTGEEDGTLLQYVTISPGQTGLTEDEIKKALSLITVHEQINDSHTVISLSGEFRMGAVIGKSLFGGEAFIGVDSRERMRQQKISELEAEFQILRKESDRLNQEIESLGRQLQKLTREEECLPVPSGIQAILNQTQIQINLIESYTIRIQQFVDEESSLVTDKIELRKSMDAMKLNIEWTVSACNVAKGEMDRYLQELVQYEMLHANLLGQQDTLAHVIERLKEQEAGINRLMGDLNVFVDDINKRQNELDAIHQKLEILQADQIKERLQVITMRLSAIEPELKKNYVEIGKKREAVENIQKSLQEKTELQGRTAVQLQHAKEILEAELHLNLVMVSGESIRDKISAILHMYDPAAKDTSQNQLIHLQQVVYKNEASNLIDYDPQMKLMFEDKAGLKATRPILELIGKSGRVVPKQAEREAEEAIKQLELHLNEEHRKLFEDVILNSLGQLIRDKISKTRQWVDNMNRIMKKRDASVKFKLEWKGKRAESGEELDTEELVELLMAEPRLLLDGDLLKLGNHFRTQIDKAREWVGQGARGVEMQEALKAVLDYREWFAFKLYGYKEGKWSEVNRKWMGESSGGQKALSVYVPLLSALFSYYEGTSPDAPRLLTLDEAFAGVDPNNIRDMFALLEEMELSYIITSQVLWGDFDSVKSLSIAHILRQQHASFATIVQFYWNGIERVPLAIHTFGD